MKAGDPVNGLKSLARDDVKAIRSLVASSGSAPFMRAVLREEMGPWVYARSAQMDALDLIPRPLIVLARTSFEHQLARSNAQAELLHRLAQTFASEGIEFLVLKGLPVAERFWGGIAHRQTADVDILVRRQAAVSALRVLEERGFVRNGAQRTSYMLARQVTHALVLRHDSIPVDLHWTFRTKPGMRLDEEGVWRDGERWQIGEADVGVPSLEHTLLNMVLGIAVDVERGICRLRKLWDVYLVLQQFDEAAWPAFLAAREREGLLPMTLNILALVLWRLHCVDEFDALSARLAEHRDLLRIRCAEDAMEVLNGSPWGVRNHVWFMKIQPVSMVRYAAWWTVTLPLRHMLGRDA